MSRKEPLTESYFYILLCLYREEMHGYGIMQETARITDNRVKIGSGTMYGAVGNMMKKGWIQEIDNPADDRKKLYRLTREGREVFTGELERVKELVANAEKIVGGNEF